MKPQDTHKKRPRNETEDRGPGPIINLFERAIAYVASLKTSALLASIPAGLQKDDGSAGTDLQVADAWLSTFWTAYISFLVSIRIPEAYCSESYTFIAPR